MNKFLARTLVLVAGLMPAFVFVPILRGAVPIFEGGYLELHPTAQGSYVHWGIYSPPFDYERQPDTVAGQVWESDGHNHQVQYFDYYRGYVVFDVPSFKDIWTTEDLGIPDRWLPGVTALRLKIKSVELRFDNIEEHELGQDLHPLELRWTSLPAAELIDGTIDPEVAFNGLGHAPRLEKEPTGLYAGSWWTSVTLKNSFTDFVKHTDGEQVVFSFTMPPYDTRGVLDLKYPDPSMELAVIYDGYAVMSPVPEPATYACAGAVLCALLAARRTVKMRRKTA